MTAGGWLVLALVAAAADAACLALVASSRNDLAIPGLFAAIMLLWFAQQQFVERHRERFGRWPPGLGMFWTGSPERREVYRAWQERAADPAVERSRWIAFRLVGLVVVSALVFRSALSR